MFGFFIDMQATYAEYEEWSEQGVPDTVVHQYKKALQQMEKCKCFEDALVTIILSKHNVLHPLHCLLGLTSASSSHCSW